MFCHIRTYSAGGYIPVDIASRLSVCFYVPLLLFPPVNLCKLRFKPFHQLLFISPLNLSEVPTFLPFWLCYGSHLSSSAPLFPSCGVSVLLWRQEKAALIFACRVIASAVQVKSYRHFQIAEIKNFHWLFCSSLNVFAYIT